MEPFKREEDLFNLHVDESAKSYILEAGRWSKFLAIIGFILISLFVIGGVLIGLNPDSLGFNEYGSSFGAIMCFVYMILAAIYFYPVYALFKFSRLSKESVLTGNQERFNRSLFFLKNQFKFWGIFTIVCLALYGFSIIMFIIYFATSRSL